MTFKIIMDSQSDWVLGDKSTEPDGKGQRRMGIDDGVKSTGAMD